ncbi:MAG: DUF6624 domain-containing protein [Lutibacter sp.]|uniref:DUF6624 domain-containing protein n=1 Tax=Lutibacter sp. TaxID=1925666 RepID=UPI00299E3B4B|nr:DUF6624 domain-containing protein [Lutibacter sp.]MDX1829818.1 DUF6624 domain-containing protein [Lutibacter sp.]
MKNLYLFLVLIGLTITACAQEKKKSSKQQSEFKMLQDREYLIAFLDTIWHKEQDPVRMRDTIIKKYGVESEQTKKYQKIYIQNHIINEKKIRNLLDTFGWPTKEMAGEHGNWTICNVIQHSDNKIRLKYLPMMKQAVKDKKLEARFLVRAEDRIATSRGDLQIYGGQMKYYPETKTFNVWPVYDPVNIDKRRAEIGLEPIATFLKRRFNFEWNLEEQIKRSEEFEKERSQKNK